MFDVYLTQTCEDNKHYVINIYGGLGQTLLLLFTV